MFILGKDQPDAWDFEDHMQRGAAYKEYLQSIRDQLPADTFAFATAPWHYDPGDPRCPHDAWVESLTITEPPTGDRSENRRLEIRVHLLGADHNGHIELTYSQVRSDSLEAAPEEDDDWPHGRQIGHGDWFVDEIRLSENGLVVHEIEFERGDWLIECEGVTYEWKPFEAR